MIRVLRVSKPSVLAKKDVTWKEAIRDATSDEGREKAQSKYKHPKIRRALEEMFHGKCAYCESKILHVDYGDIEHFRPKSVAEFYEFAVEWSNLLLACGRCNGAEYKGTKFPGTAEGGPLVDPCSEDPITHLKFEYDPTTQLANVLGVTQRGMKSVEVLGLNRRELLAHRSRFVKKLVVVARYYATNAEARALIDEAVEASAEYSAFAAEVRRTVAMPSCHVVS